MGARLEALIRELAEPLAGELGLYLYDVQVSGGRRLVVRVRVERQSKQSPEDGVMVSELTALSRRLEGLLDLEEAIPERYALEVSSPGLERPLKGRRHFEGAVGEVVRVKMQGDNATTTVEGRLVEVKGDVIVVESTNGPVELPLSKVSRAETIYRG